MLLNSEQAESAICKLSKGIVEINTRDIMLTFRPAKIGHPSCELLTDEGREYMIFRHFCLQQGIVDEIILPDQKRPIFSHNAREFRAHIQDDLPLPPVKIIKNYSYSFFLQKHFLFDCCCSHRTKEVTAFSSPATIKIFAREREDIENASTSGIPTHLYSWKKVEGQDIERME